MFYFRINKIKVFDNFESWYPWHADAASVRIVSFVNTGNDDLSDLSDWIAETNNDKKKEKLAAVAEKMVATRILTEVKNVRDGQSLTFGDTGYVLYQSKNIPDDFNWCLLVVNSERDLRKLGKLIGDIASAPEFDSFAVNLAKAVMDAVNPTYTAYVAVAQFVTKTLATVLENVEDKQLGLLYMSLDRNEHYLHGERKKDDVSDLTGNLLIDYSIFAFE